MKTPDILVLIGQVVQMFAGFILSVEVIGLKRVARWAKWLSLLHGNLADKNRNRPFFGWANVTQIVVSAFIALAMAMAGYYILRRIKPQFSGLDSVGGLIGVAAKLGGIVAWQALLYGIRGVVAGLLYIKSLSVAKTSGLVGFVLLFLGFVVQFIGTIGQTLSK
jgi:hypothetical protein